MAKDARDQPARTRCDRNSLNANHLDRSLNADFGEIEADSSVRRGTLHHDLLSGTQECGGAAGGIVDQEHQFHLPQVDETPFQRSGSQLSTLRQSRMHPLASPLSFLRALRAFA
ncbi:MAG: hypothetical protein C0478_00795 [Planctomyces sp.]|nr:hypothetical protein [Planctomyces sp.]